MKYTQRHLEGALVASPRCLHILNGVDSNKNKLSLMGLTVTYREPKKCGVTVTEATTCGFLVFFSWILNPENKGEDSHLEIGSILGAVFFVILHLR